MTIRESLSKMKSEMLLREIAKETAMGFVLELSTTSYFSTKKTQNIKTKPMTLNSSKN